MEVHTDSNIASPGKHRGCFRDDPEYFTLSDIVMRDRSVGEIMWFVLVLENRGGQRTTQWGNHEMLYLNCDA